MKRDDDCIDAILREHGIAAPWQPMFSTGIANRVYATDEIVLRVSLDEPDALADAHTEWVAAPVAHAAGVLTPRLIAVDDSRRLTATPYSIWERVHGESMGQFVHHAVVPISTWHAVGTELARLHSEVRACPDPHGWLDTPSLGDPRAAIERLARDNRIAAPTVLAVEDWLLRLEPLLGGAPPPRFVHDDLHDMNLMCRADGSLAALIDWGDAGWGDPALDFGAIPIHAMPAALEAYERVAPETLGEAVEARILWARLEGALGRMISDPRRTGKWQELVRFMREPPPRWRSFAAVLTA
jgi:aminoglycoside phosphotransferase (APT) family kinase protein